jgi:MarR family transcriptional regulator, transcriptional regulator for hemolysin
MSDLENVVLFVIDQTSKIAKQHSQRAFDRAGIDLTVDQWVLLKVINEKEFLSQNELAKESHRDPASITRTLDLLQKKGLIIREAIADNRRQYDVKLTEAGRLFVAQHMPLISELRSNSMAGFTDSEVQQLLSMLRRIQQNMT